MDVFGHTGALIPAAFIAERAVRTASRSCLCCGERLAEAAVKPVCVCVCAAAVVCSQAELCIYAAHIAQHSRPGGCCVWRGEFPHLVDSITSEAHVEYERIGVPITAASWNS